MEQFYLDTPKEGFIDITAKVKEVVKCSQIRQGICQVFVSHTTAGVTIDENADPDVVTDMLAALNDMVPKLPYRHTEGNSPAHMKSALVGCSISVPVMDNNCCWVHGRESTFVNLMDLVPGKFLFRLLVYEGCIRA